MNWSPKYIVYTCGRCFEDETKPYTTTDCAFTWCRGILCEKCNDKYDGFCTDKCEHYYKMLEQLKDMYENDVDIGKYQLRVADEKRRKLCIKDKK
jgi:hypothetical protein